MAYRVHGNKKDGVSHVGLKTTDFVLSFEILHCDLLKFQISPSKSKTSENHKITMMITRCCQMTNGKGPPMATTSIEMLCLIV
jgi:hypothetical protein